MSGTRVRANVPVRGWAEMPSVSATLVRWMIAVMLLAGPAITPERASAAGSSAARPTTVATSPDPVDIRPDSFPDSVSTGRSTALVEQFGPTAGSQVEIVNAGAWHASGIDGSGVTIGVIDFFDVSRYWDEAEHGPLPVAGATAKCFDNGDDCTDEFFDGTNEGGEDHGVAVVETILDTAPGARIIIGQALTVDDYAQLVDWFIERDVDVISRSLGSRYDGPGDGRGALNGVVDSAVARGVLWVNSAGNNGLNKYYRHAVRLIGDRVAFGASGDATFLPFAGCIALGGVRWANDWDLSPSDRTDYDVYLWEATSGDPESGAIVASSKRRQRLGAAPIENITTTRCPSPGSSLYLEVRLVSGDTSGDVLEILDYGTGISDFTSSAGSAAVSVVDSSNPGVIAVGAVDPAEGGTVARYSSQGPSNDGRIIPDVVAPANFRNTVQGRFAGTSAAAAVVAGAAALLMSADLAADAVAAGDLIRHLTIDRGEPGPDNLYGQGEFRLPEPPSETSIASTPSAFVSLDGPVRVLDTRPETAAGPSGLIGSVQRGEILDLPLAGLHGLPAAGVTAVAVNIVSVEADRPSYLQALPTNGARLGGYSNINVDTAGQTRANFAIVPLGADGSLSIYSIATGQVVVDLLGWFEATNGAVTAGRFVELEIAERVLDTRRDTPVAPLRSNGVRSAPLPRVLDPSDVAALVVTVTASEPTAPGWLQVFPTSRTDVIATTSTVNTSVGGAVANTAIVPVDDGSVSVTGFFAGNGSSHVIVDAIGYITSSTAHASLTGRFVPIAPSRAYDSRAVDGPLLDRQSLTVSAGDAPGATVPSDASGIVWNAAIVDATRPGFVRAWADNAPEPGTSALNWSTAAEVRAGAVIAAATDGRTRFRVEDGSADLDTPVGHLIVDVFGYFT